MSRTDEKDEIKSLVNAPLVISVTGHRNIPEGTKPEIKERVVHFLELLRKIFPSTELIIQTALSPGADLLVANAAIDLGLKFRAVLPCDVKRFEINSFEDGFSDDFPEMKRLLGQATETVILPNMTDDETFGEEWFHNQLKRHCAYMISTSQIILALWDGNTTTAVGGTAYLVKSAHDGVDPEELDDINRLFAKGDGLKKGDGRNSSSIAYLNIREDSLIYHIPTPRTTSTESELKKILEDEPCYYIPRPVFEMRDVLDQHSFLAPNVFGWRGFSSLPQYYKTLFGKVNEFNRETNSLVHQKGYGGIYRESGKYLFDTEDYESYCDTLDCLQIACKDAKKRCENTPERQLLSDYRKDLECRIAEIGGFPLDLERGLRGFFVNLTKRKSSRLAYLDRKWLIRETYKDQINEINDYLDGKRTSVSPALLSAAMDAMEDRAVDDFITMKKRDIRREGGRFLNGRIAFYDMIRDVPSPESKSFERLEEKCKELKTRRKNCEVFRVQIDTAEEFKSTRSGTDVDSQVTAMKETLENIKGTLRTDDCFDVFDDEQKPNPKISDSDRNLLRYCAADLLAQAQRDSNARHLWAHTVFVGLTSLFLALYLIPQNAVLFTSLYVLFLALNGLVLFRHKKSKTQAKYLEYRVLAETMRVRVYWDAIGISYPSNDNCFSYMRNDTEWIRSVLTGWYTVSTEMPDNKALIRSQSMLECCWIFPQYQYHRKKAEVDSKKSRNSKMFSMFFYIFGIVLSVSTLAISTTQIIDTSQVVLDVGAGNFIAPLVGEGTTVSLNDCIKVTIAVNNLLFVAATTYLTKMIYGGSSNSMQAKSKMFDIAFKRQLDMRVKKPKDEDEKVVKETYQEELVRLRKICGLYRELGLQSIEEVATWTSVNRIRIVDSISAASEDS